MKIQLLFLAVLHLVYCDEEQLTLTKIAESCKQPFITENFDPKWEKDQGYNENTTFYSILLSKADMFRLTQQLYHANDFEDIKESQLVNSCFRFKKDVTGNVLTMYGYNDKTFVRYLVPIVNIPKSFIFPKTFFEGLGGHVRISLSDNKSFTVLTFCHDDGIGTFAVTSPLQNLPDETMLVIKEHLKALGFKEEHFMEIDYSRDCSGTIEDVPKVVPPKAIPVAYPPVLLSNSLYHRYKK